MQSNSSAANGAEHSIVLCYGTRPQTIKASVLRRALAAVGRVLAVDTGQHYDYELNALLYSELGVQPADACLGIGSASHAEQTGGILVAAEQLLRSQPVRCVVVIGDTNSTLGCALAASKLRLPVVHVEAGLRAADQLMAEEINRRVVDAVAQMLCTPSAAATAAVRQERRDAEIIETGDVAYDVLRASLGRLPDAAGLADLRQGERYILATLHRAELTECPQVLRRILEQFAAAPCSVCLPMHPRTRAALERHGMRTASRGALRVLPAVGYLESLALIRGAAGVVTDSGGVQREAYWLGVPCVTLRHETEWVETVACGANRLLPPAIAAEALSGAIAGLLTEAPSDWDRSAYGAGDAADRVAAAIAARY